MLRNLLREISQISSKDDLLNSLNERSERSKATKLWSDTLIKGLFTMTAFGRGANEQDFPLQLAAVKAVLVTVTLFGRGWMTELPSTFFCSLFIHYMESLLTKAWKSLIIMTVVFVSSLGSTIPFSRTNSLSQHTCVLVMNQEERHAFLSNVQITNNWALSFAVCGEVRSSLNRMSENVFPTATGQPEENFRQTSTCKTAEHIATCELTHGNVNEHHGLEFGQTMVKWFRES